MRIIIAILLAAVACKAPVSHETETVGDVTVLDASWTSQADADDDCFDPSCASQMWDGPDPENPDTLDAPSDAGVPDDGAPVIVTDAIGACGSGAPILDAGGIDAGSGGGGGSGCVAQVEPGCPLAPPGYTQQSPNIQSGASCRGACGPNCPATCKPGPPTTTCLEWQTTDCTWHSKICTYPTLSCGSHEGCRIHDACYDDCARGWPGILCRRKCDEGCVAKYGLKKCHAWMKGNGPYDSWIDYAGKGTSSTYETTCY